MEPKVLEHTARADAVRLTARAPPWAPALATHGLNIRCKKTNRAPQRTYRVPIRLDLQYAPPSIVTSHRHQTRHIKRVQYRRSYGTAYGTGYGRTYTCREHKVHARSGYSVRIHEGYRIKKIKKDSTPYA